MKKHLNKTTFFILLLFTSNVKTFAATGDLSYDMINSPSMWILSIAILFVLLAFMSVSSALNNLKNAVLKSQGREEEIAEKAAQESNIMAKLTDAVPVEDEADIMLDHEYDGIRELDNNLPPWWLYGFYITIGWAAVYLFYYMFTSMGPSSAEEYEMEMAEAKAQVEAHLAMMGAAVDENSVVLLSDASALESGKKIFNANCAACHAMDGGGGVGPNLTDEYWIHGGSIQDVFKLIKYGNPSKGMIAWEEQISPPKMQEVASYILNLQGTTPADPKAPQGELYKAATEEEDASNVTDSSSTEEVISEEVIDTIAE